MNVIIGAAGFAKEVDFLLRYKSPAYKTSYFVASDKSLASIHKTPIITDEELLEIDAKNTEEILAYIAIGNPKLRNKIFNALSIANNIAFPNAIAKDAVLDSLGGRITIGLGNIICSKVVLTTDIVMGSQNHINLSCTIGHDSSIGDFCTLSPGVHVSGNVHIGSHVFVGTGAVVLEQINICSNVVIGAGAVVTKHIEEPGTYVGIPAKKLN